MRSLRFLTGVVLFALSLDAVPADGDEASEAIEQVTVTGYRIKRTDDQGPAPVVVIDHSELESAGFVTLGEFAVNLPLNWPESTSRYDMIGAAGFDLRGLGVDATLTLVNGLRVAPYAQSGGGYIDINAIPMAAIERIEVLKDGASAIYGADAVAGVVNIILRDGFDGAEVSAGYGRSRYGDGDERLADLVVGRDTERSSILFYLSGYDREPQTMADRNWGSDADFSALGGPNLRNAFSSPPSLFRYDTFVFDPDPACGTDPRISSVRASYTGGSLCAFNFAQFQDRFPAQERFGAGLSGRFEIRPRLALFGDVLWNETEAIARQSPQGIAGSALVATYFNLPFVPADHPGNPFGVEGELLSRILGIGYRVHDNDATSYRAVLGLEGLWREWDWRLTGLASRNTVEKTFRNLVFRSRYQQALLGLGGDNGDQWFNPFGFEPENDPALVDWLTTDAVLRDRATEESIDLLLSRSLGRFAGEPVGVAAGLQYRRQDLDQWADEKLLSGDLDHSHDPVTADRDIASAWIEFGLTFPHRVEAQLALRYEDYSDFGSTTNPKIGLRWQALESLALRASYATSFKPPTFYELYRPSEQDFGTYRDVERCERTGLPEDCGIRSYPVRWSGNADLAPEEGTSWFAGTVWKPEFLPGFEFQLDYWLFEHEGRIEWLGAQWVLDRKGDTGIHRAPPEPDGTPGRIVMVEERFVNAEKLETNGFDTTLLWAGQTAGGSVLRASLMHTYIDRWEYTESLGSALASVNFAGRHRGIAIPRNRANLNLSWSRGPHGAAANLHYTGHYRNHTDLYVDGEPTDLPMIIPSHTTLDLQYRFTFSRLRNAVARVGCNNVLDEDPPPTWGGVEPFHDARGRYWYVRWQQPIR